MKKKLLKAVSVLLVISMSLMAPAFSTQVRASEYIENTTVGISKNGATVTIDYSITGTGDMESIGASSVVIYKNGDPVHIFNYAEPSGLDNSNVRYTFLTIQDSNIATGAVTGVPPYTFYYPTAGGLRTVVVTVTDSTDSAAGGLRDSIQIHRFNYSPVSDLRASNAFHHSSSVQYKGSAGNTYHAVVNFYAGNGAGAETRSWTTNSVTL